MCNGVTVSSAGTVQTGGTGGANDPTCPAAFPNCGDGLFNICAPGETPTFGFAAATQPCQTNPDPANGPAGRCYACLPSAISSSAASQASSVASSSQQQQVCPACFSACGMTSSAGSNGSNASNGSNGSAASAASSTCATLQYSLGAEVTSNSIDYSGRTIAGTLRCPSGFVVTSIGYKDSPSGNTDATDGITIKCSKLETNGNLTSQATYLPNADIDSSPRQLGGSDCPATSVMTGVSQKDSPVTSPNADILDGVQRSCQYIISTGLGSVEPYPGNSDLDGNPRQLTGIFCPAGTVIVGLDYDEFGPTDDPANPDATDSIAHLYCRPLQVSCGQQAKAATKPNSLTAQLVSPANPLLAQAAGGSTPVCSGVGTQMPTCPSGSIVLCPTALGGTPSVQPMAGCYGTMTYWTQVRVGCPVGQPITQACLANSCNNKIASSCELGNGVPGCYSLGVRNVYVGQPVCAPAPAIDMKVNGSDGTITVTAGTSVTLSWTGNGVSNCNTGNSLAPWGQSVVKQPNASEQFTPTQSMTFGIQCSITADTNKIVQDSIAVIVIPAAASAGSSQSVASNAGASSVSSPLSFACLQCIANSCGPSQCTLASSSSSAGNSSNAGVSSSGSSASSQQSSVSSQGSSASTCNAGGCSQFGGDAFCKSQALACEPISQFPYYQCKGLCGNGELDPGEQCDSGKACGTSCCTATCQVSPTCACTLGFSSGGSNASVLAGAGSSASTNCAAGYSCYNNDAPCMRQGYAHQSLQNGVQILCSNPDPFGINPGATVGLCAKCVSQCGDGACEADETNQTCPSDCHVCATGNSCFRDMVQECYSQGYTNYIEQGGDKTCKPASGAFGRCGRCLARCGDNACTPGESQQICPGDCFCGDGVCKFEFESNVNCPADCKPPSCGNGQWDLGEACDKAWNSAQLEQYMAVTCKDVTYQGIFLPNGNLKCSSNCLSFDASGCTP